MSDTLKRARRAVRGAVHKALKSTHYGRSIETQFQAMYGGMEGGINRGAVFRPQEVYTAFRHANMNNGKEKPSRAEAAAKTTAFRLFAGPELNIVLAGIPFFVTCGVGAAISATRKKRQAQEAADQAGFYVPKGPAPFGKLDGEALPSAPFSDRFHKLKDVLVGYGMKATTALRLVKGEYMREDLEGVLDEADRKALMEFLMDYGEPE
ncbi:hypothetical protein [Roseomonas sp. BN140053]|uniref:hypothetical protein n=1 Tax=Roseomonas sp. BN140053 TaxID=3391898 RepID=UPI0039EA70FA